MTILDSYFSSLLDEHCITGGSISLYVSLGGRNSHGFTLLNSGRLLLAIIERCSGSGASGDMGSGGQMCLKLFEPVLRFSSEAALDVPSGSGGTLFQLIGVPGGLKNLEAVLEFFERGVIGRDEH
ncbi:MAG: hypothetical protein [Circoviridae sp.]|nr:MAG: hypothetical protein [Circoviridae sp.]